jgi:hypothetical protein
VIPRSLAELTAAAMEALWVYAALAMFAQIFAGGRGPSAAILIATACSAVLITRLVRSFEVSQVALAAVGGMLSLLCIYALVRIDYLNDLALWDLAWSVDLLFSPGEALVGQSALVVGGLSVFALWVRWLILVQNKLPPEDVRSSFSIGILVYAVAVLARNDLDAGDTVIALVLPYIATGLVAIALNQQVETGRMGGLSIGGSWGLALLITLGGIFLLAGMAALVPATGLSEPLLPLWRGILIAGAVALLLMALPFVLLTELFLIVVPIESLLGDLPQPEQQARELVQSDDEGGGSDFGWVLISLRVLGGIAVVAFIVILLSSLFLYLRRRTDDEEDRESVTPTGSIVDDILSLLKGLRPGRGRPAARLPDLSQNGLALRQLYLGVVAEAEKRGAERRPSMTPGRFAPAMDTVLGLAGFGREVTQEFERVRYARAEISSGRLHELQQQWRSLH